MTEPVVRARTFVAGGLAAGVVRRAVTAFATGSLVFGAFVGTSAGSFEEDDATSLNAPPSEFNEDLPDELQGVDIVEHLDESLPRFYAKNREDV